MRTFAAGVSAALASAALAKATLVKFDFPSGTIGLNSSCWNLVFGGVTYLGAQGLGAIAQITDNPGQLPGIQLELQNVDPAHISLALDDADQVQGSPVSIRTAIFDIATYTILDAPLDWAGYCDKMAIIEDGGKAVIGVTTESKGVDLLRGNPLFYSDADQQSLVPGDRYFEYVVAQSDQPVVWPSKELFFK